MKKNLRLDGIRTRALEVGARRRNRCAIQACEGERLIDLQYPTAEIVKRKSGNAAVLGLPPMSSL